MIKVFYAIDIYRLNICITTVATTDGCVLFIEMFSKLDTAGEFELRGGCLDTVDTRYLMINSSYFLGHVNSSLAWSALTNQWQIHNSFTKDLIAFMEGAERNFPLGTHTWYFPDINCTEPGQEGRKMKLHRRIVRPGWFCCDDGVCIDSGKGSKIPPQ